MSRTRKPAFGFHKGSSQGVAKTLDEDFGFEIGLKTGKAL